jgi:hypothetical protein
MATSFYSVGLRRTDIEMIPLRSCHAAHVQPLRGWGLVVVRFPWAYAARLLRFIPFGAGYIPLAACHGLYFDMLSKQPRL